MDIITAAQQQRAAAALAYQQLGLSVLPLQGKLPAINAWREYQQRAATGEQVRRWWANSPLANIGIISGDVSNNLVVFDLDGLGAVDVFSKRFPALYERTYRVLSGSRKGEHVYVFANKLPPTTRLVGADWGNIEMRANGCYVAAPPSVHPDSHQRYTVSNAAGILRVAHLDDIQNWLNQQMAATRPARAAARPARESAPRPVWDSINPRVISAIEAVLRGKGYELTGGTWLHGACLFSERHKHGDKNASFGFDTATGRANCYSCGFIRTIDVCIRLDIDVNRYGGLWERR